MFLVSTLVLPIRQPKFRISAQPSPVVKPLAFATVAEAILPGGYGQVYFAGTYWRAKFHDPDCQVTAGVGDKVQVVVCDRLPLLVMPA